MIVLILNQTITLNYCFALVTKKYITL